jgi:hypothetical protein
MGLAKSHTAHSPRAQGYTECLIISQEYPLRAQDLRSGK